MTPPLSYTSIPSTRLPALPNQMTYPVVVG